MPSVYLSKRESKNNERALNAFSSSTRTQGRASESRSNYSERGAAISVVGDDRARRLNPDLTTQQPSNRPKALAQLLGIAGCELVERVNSDVVESPDHALSEQAQGVQRKLLEHSLRVGRRCRDGRDLPGFGRTYATRWVASGASSSSGSGAVGGVRRLTLISDR